MAEIGRDDLLFAAEVATRYHRRRATFLADSDRLLTFFQLLAGASAFGTLITAGGTLFAQWATALVTGAATIQAVFGMSVAACGHEGWLKRWSDLLVDIRLNVNPDAATLASWERQRAMIEQEHVGELRALERDCHNKARRALGWQGEEKQIGFVQRLLIQVVSFPT